MLAVERSPLLNFLKFMHELLHPVTLIVVEMSRFAEDIEPVLPIARYGAAAAKNERSHHSTEMRDVLFNERVCLHLLTVLAATPAVVKRWRREQYMGRKATSTACPFSFSLDERSTSRVAGLSCWETIHVKSDARLLMQSARFIDIGPVFFSRRLNGDGSRPIS
jgi:hypothetical protein